MVWNDPIEVKQAVELLQGWVEIDVEDALELLGQAFDNPSVRSYAVLQLKKADDEVIYWRYFFFFTLISLILSLYIRNYNYIFFSWFKL